MANNYKDQLLAELNNIRKQEGTASGAQRGGLSFGQLAERGAKFVTPTEPSGSLAELAKKAVIPPIPTTLSDVKDIMHPVAGKYGVGALAEKAGSMVERASTDIASRMPDVPYSAFYPSPLQLSKTFIGIGGQMLTPSSIQQQVGAEGMGIAAKAVPELAAAVPSSVKEFTAQKAGRVIDVAGGFQHGTGRAALATPEAESLTFYDKKIAPVMGEIKRRIDQFYKDLKAFYGANQEAIEKRVPAKTDIQDVRNVLDESAKDLFVEPVMKTTVKKGKRTVTKDITTLGVKGKSTATKGTIVSQDLPKESVIGISEKTSPIPGGVRKTGRKVTEYKDVIEKPGLSAQARPKDVMAFKELNEIVDDIVQKGDTKVKLSDLVKLRQKVKPNTNFTSVPDEYERAYNKLYSRIDDLIEKNYPDFKKYVDPVYAQGQRAMRNVEDATGIGPKTNLAERHEFGTAEKRISSYLGGGEGEKGRFAEELKETIGPDVFKDIESLSASKQLSDIGAGMSGFLNLGRRLPIKYAFKAFNKAKTIAKSLAKRYPDSLATRAVQAELLRQKKGDKE